MRANNAQGNGETSQITATTGVPTPAPTPEPTPQPTTPAAPSGLTGTGIGGGIEISWNDPSDSSITGYQFRVRTTGATDWRAWNNVANSDSSTTGHTLKGLSGASYDIEVRANNAQGNGAASQITATTS